MAQPSSAYEPRDPTSTILYGIVRDHFETFRAHAASLRDGEEVLLCWQVGEEEIAYWHGLEEGFAGRKPLP